jgi:hypothetical protein
MVCSSEHLETSHSIYKAQLIPPIPNKSFGMNGGDDGARTRDLCRDSPYSFFNGLASSSKAPYSMP